MSRARSVSLLAVLSLGCVAQASAQAPSLVMLMSPSEAWGLALSVELAPRGARVVYGAPLPAVGASDRALAARASAHAGGADVAMWTEMEADGTWSVRAVRADSGLVAWAPLSSPDADPRVLALVSASLLDELMVPAPPAASPQLVLTIRVPGPSATLDEPAPAPSLPSPEAPPSPEALPSPEPRARRPYLELGTAIAGVAFGGDFGAGLFPTHNLRLSIHARPLFSLLGVSFVGQLSVGADFVGDGEDGRFEIGVDAGAMLIHQQADLPGAFAGLQAGGSWAAGDVRLGFRVAGYGAWVGDLPFGGGLLTLYLQVEP